MNLRGLFCTGLLILATGCGARLPQSVSTADALPSSTDSLSSSVVESSSSSEASEAPDLSSISDSSSSSEASEAPDLSSLPNSSSSPVSTESASSEDGELEWDSVYAATTVVTNRGASWYIWENTVKNDERIRALWEIVQATTKTEPSESDTAPEGGFAFEVTFISDSRSIECAFYSRSAFIDGTWYDDFNDETYNRILELVGASELIQPS